MPDNQRIINAGLILGAGQREPKHPIVIRPETIVRAAAAARQRKLKKGLAKDA